jgi:hypothetical protein
MSAGDSMTLFATWAPESARWSPWAKPVLFTYQPPAVLPLPPTAELAPERAPSPGERVAIVVDMPGVQSVACGMMLAERGFRPVPLFNTTFGPGSNLHDVGAVLGSLVVLADQLAALRLPDDAPPAFLIDSGRLKGTPAPASYDNRWMVFPQDFPSARALRASGIESVVVVRRDESAMEPDLRAVLRYWSRDGVSSSLLDPASGARRDAGFDASLLALLTDHMFSWFQGLRRNSAGGFGGVVPMPTATGGGGWA